jgi:hypothetical protein
MTREYTLRYLDHRTSDGPCCKLRVWEKLERGWASGWVSWWVSPLRVAWVMGVVVVVVAEDIRKEVA